MSASSCHCSLRCHSVSEDYRTADDDDFKWMNDRIVDAFISVLREHPTEAEPYLHSIVKHIRNVFLQETQSRSDLISDRAFGRLQTFIREESYAVPELRNMKELYPYMKRLLIETSARDLAAASLLSLGGVIPLMECVEGMHENASLEAQGYAHAPQHAWVGS
jgi:hypothetical protein